MDLVNEHAYLDLPKTKSERKIKKRFMYSVPKQENKYYSQAISSTESSIMQSARYNSIDK